MARANISRQQAEALAEGFLDNIGSDQNEFQPKETYTELIMVAGEFIGLCQDNLISARKIHTGALSASITAEEPKESNDMLSITITMLPYGEFINSGVRGTKGGTGKYAFKHDMPGTKMIDSIKEWIKTSQLSSTNISRAVSHHEVKHVSIGQATISPFAIARSVLQHGIPATGFVDKALMEIMRRYDVVFYDALKKDILNALPDKL